MGGGVGSVLRYALALAVPAGSGDFPVATLITNLLGSLLLGALVVAVTEIWRPYPLVRPGFGTGLLGGFTTFSTFAVETRTLALPVAVAYAVATVVGGLVLAAVGMAVVRRLESRFRVAPVHERVDPFDPDLP